MELTLKFKIHDCTHSPGYKSTCTLYIWTEAYVLDVEMQGQLLFECGKTEWLCWYQVSEWRWFARRCQQCGTCLVSGVLEYKHACSFDVLSPPSVAIDASSYGFQFYSKGVYTDDSCSQNKLNHGVLVTGYGVSNNQAYWAVKNRSKSPSL